MDWIGQVAKHHKLYINYVNGMNVNTHAEDLVQEMYLRIHMYASAEKCITNGKVNKHYIWRVLYNICQTYRKDSKRFEMVSIECYDLVYEQCNNEREDAYERIIQKLHNEMDSLDDIKKKKKGKEVYPYNKELLSLYAYTDLSYRGIEDITKISLTSIYNTIKQCKEHLSDEIREDIEDFYHGEFELIL